LLEPLSEADEKEGILISHKTVTTSFCTNPFLTTPSLRENQTSSQFSAGHPTL